MNETERSISVLIDYTQKINIIRFLGNVLIPSELIIKAEVVPSDSVEEIDFDVAFAKIKFWFDTIVSRSIVFCRSNKTALEMMMDSEGRPRLTNHMMLTPFEPNDEHLASLFQAKMTALSGDTMNFGCIQIRTDTSGLMFTYIGDHENDLPEMKEWFDTKPYYFDIPWWNRDDVSTIDMIIGEDADLTIAPGWALKLDFIEDTIRPKKDTDKEEIVIKGSFQPKVIDGEDLEE